MNIVIQGIDGRIELDFHRKPHLFIWLYDSVGNSIYMHFLDHLSTIPFRFILNYSGYNTVGRVAYNVWHEREGIAIVAGDLHYDRSNVRATFTPQQVEQIKDAIYTGYVG